MEPPANFKDRQKWYAGHKRATQHLYPHKKKPKKEKKKHGRGHKYTPPLCFSFFQHTASARKYAQKFRGLTKAEWEVWSRLRFDPLHKWHKQVPCGSYILDFYCHETRTVVEIDGPEHYTKEGLAHDAQRTGFLKHRHKLRVHRYKNDDAYLDGDILAALIIRENNAPRPLALPRSDHSNDDLNLPHTY